ncbi:hypothetical protein [Sphingomonas sp. SRS2]|uniref:hypothetical protein n=1 Tax=Sphingomonas sp. SRS2 TaxID=133190 RepID=UPI00061841CA|nr:hypothetical protein [Sphingomonas sp. SRS2]KKC27995.1 hypothetical protein WP12_00225 [Sphingomonas sp. SRS2]
MPMRPDDISLLPQLKRFATAGVNVITLNIGYGPAEDFSDGFPAITKVEAGSDNLSNALRFDKLQKSNIVGQIKYKWRSASIALS